MVDGGYDSGYAACKCFWGTEPGSLLLPLASYMGSFEGMEALDVGCGEGKNAVFLAARGANVRAVDVSALALDNAAAAWGPVPGVTWEVGDARGIALQPRLYDIIVLYGLLHCMVDQCEVDHVVLRLKEATSIGGYHVVCAFNNRSQDLSAHSGFTPCLLSHTHYADLYDDWEILEISDADLTEVHPHNQLQHTHSMTRLIARRLA